MNHYSKLSLILLIPFATIASSDAEKKTAFNKGVTYVPGRAAAAAVAAGGQASAGAAAAVASQPSAGAAAAVAAQSSAIAQVSHMDSGFVHVPAEDAPGAAAAASSVATDSDELGAPYRRIPCSEQKNPYIVGNALIGDGIAKITGWESSVAYIVRLLRDGKFADAVKHKGNSNIPDHLRRALVGEDDSKKDSSKKQSLKESLLETTKANREAISKMLKAQRETINEKHKIYYSLLDAAVKYTPTGLALDTITEIQEGLLEVQKMNAALLAIIIKEIQERNSFLDDLAGLSDKLREAISASASKKGDK
jgi:hypothetical protein